ncbi:biogenesis of lysosome-related organelles complex 1 subunit 5-like isoform 2-T2 [Salvelinus alpinus]|uniref:biogenesis of lysosome-related organelles complex 1 subunit 5 isoform X2 n=1 Tax=Salvelinus alpinus TaxID=8036 RepID=UPI0039FCB9B2
MDKIAKDVGDIQSRLIDHRPVIQGEIRYFVREFEEKRGFRESRLLDNLNKMVVETNEQMLPKCSEHMHQHLFEALTRRSPFANAKTTASLPGVPNITKNTYYIHVSQNFNCIVLFHCVLLLRPESS